MRQNELSYIMNIREKIIAMSETCSRLMYVFVLLLTYQFYPIGFIYFKYVDYILLYIFDIKWECDT
jgi:hypothetical protein